MGYVPQEDVMHRALTASEVLFFTGRLSYPDDASGEEIRARVAKVLKQLDLSHVADSVVGDEVTRGLSGGERKRLNVGMELMKEPALLLLDEPTSGLDGRSAMQLVKQCRGLANSGRTVMMTIHQPRQEVLQLFDKVLFLTHGGKLAYFGPPARIRHYFQQRVTGSPITATNPSDYALEALEPTDRSSAKPPEYWEKAYRNSDLFGQYVEKGSPSGELTAVKAAAAAAVGQHGAVRQFVTLAWRYGLVKLRDRGALLLLLLQAPIIAAVTALLFSRARFVPLRGEDDVTPALFVLMAAAVWFGTSNVAREVIGEKAIFTRESRRAVTAGPYFLGMVVVQSAIMLAQLLVLVGTVFFVVKLQCNVGLLLLVAFAAGVAGMMMGLLLSALVRSQLAALVFVPLLILPQLLLSGQFAPVGGTDVALVTKVAASPMLVRWAFSAATQVEYPPVTDEMDNADPATYRAEKGREWVLPRLGFDKDIQGIPLLLCVSIGFLAAIATYLLLLRRGRGGGSEPPARRDAIKAK
jgi:ABC-type multidrug transport system ATPase subunit/ABC-type multidrug transport system permease subunit